MPDLFSKPAELKPGQRSISAEAINKLIRMAPALITGGDGVRLSKMGDRFTINQDETFSQDAEQIKTFVVVQEFVDVLACVSFSFKNTVQEYDPELGTVPDNNDQPLVIVYVAKPPWLQQSPYQDKTLDVDDLTVELVLVDEHTRLYTVDDASTTQVISPSYYKGAIISARFGPTGYEADDLANIVSPVVWTDLNETARIWKSIVEDADITDRTESYVAQATSDITASTLVTTAVTQLNGAINDTVNVFDVDDVSFITLTTPASVAYVIVIGTEQMLVTYVDTLTITVTRGFADTVAVAHADNAVVNRVNVEMGHGFGIVYKGTDGASFGTIDLTNEGTQIQIYNRFNQLFLEGDYVRVLYDLPSKLWILIKEELQVLPIIAYTAADFAHPVVAGTVNVQVIPGVGNNIWMVEGQSVMISWEVGVPTSRQLLYGVITAILTDNYFQLTLERDASTPSVVDWDNVTTYTAGYFVKRNSVNYTSLAGGNVGHKPPNALYWAVGLVGMVMPTGASVIISGDPYPVNGVWSINGAINHTITLTNGFAGTEPNWQLIDDNEVRLNIPGGDVSISGGLITNGTQSFAGIKTFVDPIVVTYGVLGSYYGTAIDANEILVKGPDWNNLAAPPIANSGTTVTSQLLGFANYQIATLLHVEPGTDNTHTRGLILNFNPDSGILSLTSSAFGTTLSPATLSATFFVGTWNGNPISTTLGGLGSDTSGYGSAGTPTSDGAGNFVQWTPSGSGPPSAGMGSPGSTYIDFSDPNNPVLYYKS